jgi:fatty-acyl-CoA synthase
VMAGYYGDEAATAEAITPDGWLRTGDLGHVDAAGYLRITGRAKDMIIRGGENLYPAEIESALRGIDGVVDAAVVGVPDDVYGEVPAAFVRLADGAALDLASMRAALDGRIARFKVPAHLRVVEAFPLTPSGKVQKFRLRELL